MIINLIRESDSALHAEAPGVPAHRVAAFPFEDAEREVRRRVLRSLADRANPPTAVVFVRTWEHSAICDPDSRRPLTVEEVRAGAWPGPTGPTAAQAIAVAAFPEDAGVSEVPVTVEVSAEQVAAPPRSNGVRKRALKR